MLIMMDNSEGRTSHEVDVSGFQLHESLDCGVGGEVPGGFR